jgi:hypothetical protein
METRWVLSTWRWISVRRLWSHLECVTRPPKPRPHRAMYARQYRRPNDLHWQTGDDGERATQAGYNSRFTVPQRPNGPQQIDYSGLFVGCRFARGGGRSLGRHGFARLSHEIERLGTSPFATEAFRFLELFSDGFVRVIREHGS